MKAGGGRSAGTHLTLLGLWVPEPLVADVLNLHRVQPDPVQQGLTLQQRHHHMVWQLTRVHVHFSVKPWPVF